MGGGMVNHIVIVILTIGLIILLIRHISVKSQLKSINQQLQEKKPRHRSVSIELLDCDIKSLALTINQTIEEYNGMVMETEKENKNLKNSIVDISHDMRTPLTSIIGYLQLLNRSDLGAEQRQYLEIVFDKSIYLRKLLSDFHQLSALNAREAITEFEKIDLAGIISDIILDNVNEFTKKDILPIFEQSHIPVFIMGELKTLQRAIQNLVSNCLKYSNGDVVFTLVEGDTVTLTIENPATNLKDINLTRLFDRFYKGDSSRAIEGTGLGLPIVRLIIENMNGEIQAYVTDEIFTVKIIFSKYENNA